MEKLVLQETLRFAVEKKASDIHFSSGMSPVLRIMGQLKKIDMAPLTKEHLTGELEVLLDKFQKSILKSGKEVDFAIDIKDIARFLVNIFKHINGISAAFRVIYTGIRTLDDLGMPLVLKQILQRQKGLILMTGPAGSGKSTTLTAMLHEINITKRKHIITIEEPIEYVHKPMNSLIHQREVGVHTNDFASALRAAMREDPDVILVGEMRDHETIANALHAAETGHLVLLTLHTNSAAESIDRIINVFPGEQQPQIRVVLASTLIAVLAQRLVPKAGEKERIALLEILISTDAVKNLIREKKNHQIDSAIQTGTEVGMQSFAKSLEKLKQDNLISPDLIISEIV